MSDLRKQWAATSEPEMYNQTKGSSMIYYNEADLHTLLDSLKDGDHIKATWVHGAYLTTTEGPVNINGQGVRCNNYLRWDNGTVHPFLISLEIAHDEEVTTTIDDEEEMIALIDSLENGDAVTAEWRNRDGSMSVTGTTQISDIAREVCGPVLFPLRWHDRGLHNLLYSITVRRPVVQRWEREGDK